MLNEDLRVVSLMDSGNSVGIILTNASNDEIVEAISIVKEIDCYCVDDLIEELVNQGFTCLDYTIDSEIEF